MECAGLGSPMELVPGVSLVHSRTIPCKKDRELKESRAQRKKRATLSDQKVRHAEHPQKRRKFARTTKKANAQRAKIVICGILRIVISGKSRQVARTVTSARSLTVKKVRNRVPPKLQEALMRQDRNGKSRMMVRQRARLRSFVLRWISLQKESFYPKQSQECGIMSCHLKQRCADMSMGICCPREKS